MPKSSIPVYDICSLTNHLSETDLIVDRFAHYLDEHKDLHFPHKHSFYHIVLFTKGQGLHSIDFVGFPVQPMQIYFMAPGQVHSWFFEGETDGYIINFSERLFSSFLLDTEYLAHFSFFNGVENSVHQLNHDLYNELIVVFEKLIAETGRNHGNVSDLSRLYILQLLMLVNREHESGAKPQVKSHQKQIVQSFQKSVEANYLKMHLPKDYAALLALTPNYLNAICNEVLGKPAGDLIRNRRLLEAKRLLINAKLSVSEIAFKLHFQDHSYFTKFFKKYENMTPDEFRKKEIL